MCYQTALTKSETQIQEAIQKTFQIPGEFEPYYHYSGFTHPNLQIIKMDDPDSIFPASWGYLPSWASGDIPAFRKKYNTLNIRYESLFSGISKEAALTNRCLIIADGFFEPHKVNNISIPNFCYIPTKTFPDGRDLFLFGGIYSQLEKDSDRYSCAILTMEANPFFSEIHNVKKRQPFVVDEGLYSEWLNTSLKKENVTELIKNGFTSKEFTAHPISRDLYKPGVDTNKKYILEKETPDGFLF